MAFDLLGQTTKQQITAVYVAYYGRAPDPQGLNFWINEYNNAINGGQSPADAIKNIAASFAVAEADGSPSEAQELYPFLTAPLVGDAGTFVDAVYQNLFNRAPDAEGRAFWTGEINTRIAAGGVGEIATVIIDIISGANVENGDAGAVANKIAAGTDYADSFVNAGVTWTEADLTNARGVVGDVTSEQATLDTALAETDAIIAAATQNKGQVVTLTEGPDDLTGNIFDAPRTFTPDGSDQVNSLNDDDVLTGTGENPTLNFDFVNDADTADYDIQPILKGVEVVNVKFALDAGPAFIAKLDLQDASGLSDAVNVSRIDDDLVGAYVQNMELIPGLLSVSDTNAQGTKVWFTFQDSAVSGATDSVNLKLDDVQLNVLRVEQDNNAGNAQAGTGLETINMESINGLNILGKLQAEDLETLSITGSGGLQISNDVPVTNAGLVEATFYNDSLISVEGSLTKIDASGLTGGLKLAVGNEINAGLDGTSGKSVDLVVNTGAGDDFLWLIAGQAIDKADAVDMGEGNDTFVLFGTAINGTVAGAENLEIRTGHDAGAVADVVTIDASKISALVNTTYRNEGNNGAVAPTSNAEGATVTVTKLTADQAKNITLEHGTSGNNGTDENILSFALATATGTTDLLSLKYIDAANSDARFNFEVTSAGFESITLTDADTESNSILLNSDFQAVGTEGGTTGTLTITGGQAGDFINLDFVDSVGGDNDITEAADNKLGIFQKDFTSNPTPADGKNLNDAGVEHAVRLSAAKIDASASLSDVVLRVQDPSATTNPTGAQTILMGKGNDTVIFDEQQGTGKQTAGLTISDTVTAGEGTDNLVIDGHGTKVNISASEWTNVSGFENLWLIGLGNPGQTKTPENSTAAFGNNEYNLVITNSFVASNGVASGSNRVINIINDNDRGNEFNTVTKAYGLDTVGTAANDGVTIDARTLNDKSNFTYDGEEGAGRTDDRFIFSDANINGVAVIDGGAVLAGGNAASNAGNNDVLEVRNTAVVTIGDIANIKNVSNIEFTNDQSVPQTLTLQLDNSTVDSLVNSSQAAKMGAVETLNIRAIDNPTVAGAFSVLDINATGITSAFLSLNVIGDGGNDTVIGGAGADTFTLVEGVDSVTGGGGIDTLVANFGTKTDIFTDFTQGTGGDEIDISLAALEDDNDDGIGDGIIDGSGIAANVTNFTKLNSAADGADALVGEVTIQELTSDGVGSAINAANADVFVITGNTQANVGVVGVGLEAGGDFELTIDAADDVVGQAFLVVYSDGINAYLAAAYVDTVTAGDTNFEAGDLTVVNLVNLGADTAIAAGEYTSANFDFIA